jgi:hypothetical protein
MSLLSDIKASIFANALMDVSHESVMERVRSDQKDHNLLRMLRVTYPNFHGDEQVFPLAFATGDLPDLR